MRDFEYFDGDISGRNHYFALDENKILEVSRVDDAGAYYKFNPRREAQSTFITFDGWQPDQNTPDEPDFEDITQMAEHFGVPEEKVFLPETEEGTSWGKLIEAANALPDEIISAATEKGVPMLAVYGDVYTNPGAGYSLDPDDKLPFAGFIYDESGRMDREDLAKDVEAYNAFLTRDTYQTRIYNIDPETNTIDLNPSEPTGILYGYDADTNGFSDEIDTDMYLGAAYDINDLAKTLSAKEIAGMVRENVNPSNYFRNNFGYMSGGVDVFMHDKNHILAIGLAEAIDDPREFARSSFLSFDDNGDVASESPDHFGIENVFELADHFGVSDETARAAFDDAGVEGVLREIEYNAEKNGIAMLPVRCDISGYHDEFSEGYPMSGELPGLIYSDDKGVTVAELSEDVRQYSEYLKDNECEYAVYPIVDKFDDKGHYEGLGIDEENPAEGGFLYSVEYTDNGLDKIQDLHMYIGPRAGFSDVSYGLDSKTLSRMQKAFDVYEAQKAAIGVAKGDHEASIAKSEKEVDKNKNVGKDNDTGRDN